jgi:hypothetical protein
MTSVPAVRVTPSSDFGPAVAEGAEEPVRVDGAAQGEAAAQAIHALVAVRMNRRQCARATRC